MFSPAPSFPTIDEWRNMSEPERDALLDRIGTAQRRTAIVRSLLAGLACVIIPAALACVSLLVW
jgi:hypothetical protein